MDFISCDKFMISTSSPYSKLKPNENISGIDISAPFETSEPCVCAAQIRPLDGWFWWFIRLKIGAKVFFFTGKHFNNLKKPSVFAIFEKSLYETIRWDTAQMPLFADYALSGDAYRLTGTPASIFADC